MTDHPHIVGAEEAHERLERFRNGIRVSIENVLRDVSDEYESTVREHIAIALQEAFLEVQGLDMPATSRHLRDDLGGGT